MGHVTVKERDHLREKSFKDAYGLDTKIHVTSYNDDNWNWDMVAINFIDTHDRKYSLIEHFKEGDDNSTKFVILEYSKDDSFKQERFERFIEAELAMVQLMKEVV